MCQFGDCDWTAEFLVTSFSSREDVAVCERHLSVGTDPQRIVS